MKKTSFHYVIKVKGKVVWKGLNPKKKYRALQRKHRDRVSLAWVPREGVLVCLL